VAIVLGVAAAAGARSLLSPHLYAGTVMQSDEPAPSLAELTLASGEPVELATWDDEVTLVYFGYLNCPDVCPTTLATVAQARAQLNADQRDRLNLIMISVDPDRDPAERLQRYVASFDPSFLGATGSVDAIDRAATAYGVYYRLNTDETVGSDATSQTGYTVDHTASLMGVDTDGALRMVWGPTVSAEDLAADFDALLGG
jgi:protein SCO1/2